MNTKIQVTKKPNKSTREIYTFVTCSSVNGIVLELDTYSKYRMDDDNEFVAVQSYARTTNVTSNTGPRYNSKRSREEILKKKNVPSEIKSQAIAQLMERIEFVC